MTPIDQTKLDTETQRIDAIISEHPHLNREDAAECLRIIDRFSEEWRKRCAAQVKRKVPRKKRHYWKARGWV